MSSLKFRHWAKLFLEVRVRRGGAGTFSFSAFVGTRIGPWTSCFKGTFSLRSYCLVFTRRRNWSLGLQAGLFITEIIPCSDMYILTNLICKATRTVPLNMFSIEKLEVTIILYVLTCLDEILISAKKGYLFTQIFF